MEHIFEFTQWKFTWTHEQVHLNAHVSLFVYESHELYFDFCPINFDNQICSIIIVTIVTRS